MKKVIILSLLLSGCTTWINPDKTRIWEIDLSECRTEATKGRWWWGAGGQRVIDERTHACLYRRGWKKEVPLD